MCNILYLFNINDFQEVRVETLPIYFCGRYCKYSRILSQTPWHLDNAPTDKEEENGNNDIINNCFINCVQDIIFDGIQEIFGCVYYFFH